MTFNIQLEDGSILTEVIWFTNPTTETGCIGIVTVNNGKETKSYIGLGYGKNEVEDSIRIAKFGSRFIKGME
jgi:hypothetical protein